MKHLRQLCIGFILVLALSIPAFAGDMECGVTGDMPMGVIGQLPGGVTGEIPGPGVTGTIDCGITGDMLSLFLAILY